MVAVVGSGRRVHTALLDRRRLLGRWRLRFDRAGIRAALESDKYWVEGVAGTLVGTNARDKAQRLAVSIVDQLLGKLYRKRESAKSRYRMTDVGDSMPRNYRRSQAWQCVVMPLQRRVSASPMQGTLLGGTLDCPLVEHLPLIIEDGGKLEVLAPGHLHQPLLLDPGNGAADIKISPGALEANERKFVVDLIKRLYPDGSPPRSLGAPLKWGNREIHLRRNLEKDPGSFRLRVDDSDWYY